MPKLLRIVGDINQSNNTVRAVFNPPVPLPKGSKIGLQSLKVEFLDSAVNDTFTITAGDSIIVNGLTVSLTPGTYSEEALDQMLTNTISLVAGIDTNPGLLTSFGQNYGVETDNTTSLKTFTQYEADEAEIDFDNDYNVLAGNPNVSGSSFDANGSADDVTVLGVYSVTNASFAFEGRVQTVDQFTTDVCLVIDDYRIFGVGISAGGFWQYRFDGTTTVTALVPVAGDAFSMRRSGTTVIWTFWVGGVRQPDITQTVTSAIQAAINADLGNYLHIVEAPAGSTAVVQNMTATAFDDGTPATTTQCTITLNPVTSKIARYLGLKNVESYRDTGNPAEISSEKDVKGDSAAAGFMVVVDPNILESYQSDARDQRRGRLNVLYTIDSDDLGDVINERPPYLTLLDVKNVTDSQITQLNITFRAASDNRLLQFADSPALTLVIEN